MPKARIMMETGEIAQVISLEPKVFKTGNTGFYGFGKVNLDGGRYQASFVLAKINTKAKAKK